VGHDAQLPIEWMSEEHMNADGRLVVPGLVDCHTHLAFGGWRADEFEARLKGASYLEIAKRGGGIMRTVAQTRASSIEELAARSETFLDGMRRLGVTTVEVKSGYGLTVTEEVKQLRVYRSLLRRQPTRLVPTFLAHTVPPEYEEDRAEYVKMLTDALIPAIAEEKLAEFCDVFVEDGAFTVDEGRAILTAGQRAGLIPKIHADQFHDTGGAVLAAKLRAASADHLECISKDGIGALAAAGTVAVSLPIAALYLNQQALPARDLIEAGVPVAVATDFNPGSAPSYHLPLAMTLACVRQRMTPNEALKGATLIAARALHLDGTVGSVEVGKSADLLMLNAPDVSHWLYHFRDNLAHTVVLKGNAYETND
jgi:imidazolonepropionase